MGLFGRIPCISQLFFVILRQIDAKKKAPIIAKLMNNMTIDTTNMCSHLQRKLFEGEYRTIREQIESDPTLTAVVRSRQLHIYREGKKILVLAGKSAPKIIRKDKLTELLF